MKKNIANWKNGIIDGIPIFLGYLAVSFTFGIMAKQAGLTPFEAVVMSATNLTSAGQFAALGLIGSSSTFMEMAVMQFILNLRYCLMSCSISQKLDSKIPLLHRSLIAYGVTDEIFGVSVCKRGALHPFYSYGLMSAAIPGWTLGTLLGTISGSILPERILSALGIAIYGMFLAIILPPAKNNKVLSTVIGLSMLLHLLFVKLPAFASISAGFKIIILTILIAGAAAFFFPVKEPEEPEAEDLSYPAVTTAENGGIE